MPSVLEPITVPKRTVKKEILDEYTRECHVLWAERALKSADVLHWLQKAVEQHGAPEFLRSDNGSEFIVSAVTNFIFQLQTLFSGYKLYFLTTCGGKIKL
jgi:hypothetical protein